MKADKEDTGAHDKLPQDSNESEVEEADTGANGKLPHENNKLNVEETDAKFPGGTVSMLKTLPR